MRNTAEILLLPKKYRQFSTEDNTTPSNKMSHRTSHTELAFCRQAVPNRGKIVLFSDDIASDEKL